MERGREQPPGFIATAAPRPFRRVAHAPVSVSRSLAEGSSDLRAVCTRVVTCVHAADHTGIALRLQHRSAKVLALLRPSHRQRQAVLGLVKALRYAPTRCAGLRALTTPRSPTNLRCYSRPSLHAPGQGPDSLRVGAATVGGEGPDGRAGEAG